MRLESLFYSGIDGCYMAYVYNPIGGYSKIYRFLYYTKKEALYLLRHKYNVTCPHGTY